MGLKEFAASLDLLLLNCVIRLEDSSSAVASAAGRCLKHLVTALAMPAGKAAEAAELLLRRETDGTGFEQFIFPFVALVHRPDDIDLVTRRLELCRMYFVIGGSLRGQASSDVSSGGATGTVPPSSNSGSVVTPQSAFG